MKPGVPPKLFGGALDQNRDQVQCLHYSLKMYGATRDRCTFDSQMTVTE